GGRCVGHLPGARRRRSSGCLVVPEPGRGGPVHLGADGRMSTLHDLPTLAPPAPSSPPAGTDPPKFPDSPYLNAARYFGAYAEETARAASSGEEHALAGAAPM